MVGPPLLLAGSVAWVFGADQLRLVLQFYAAIVIVLGLIGIGLSIAPRAPRPAAALLVLAVLGFAAGGMGFAVDALHGEKFGSPSLADEGGLAGSLVPTLPGLLGPLTLIALGGLLWRRHLAPRWSAVAFILGGLAFPLSRIGEIAPLAVVVDVLLLVALVPLGWRMAQGRDLSGRDQT